MLGTFFLHRKPLLAWASFWSRLTSGSDWQLANGVKVNTPGSTRIGTPIPKSKDSGATWWNIQPPQMFSQDVTVHLLYFKFNTTKVTSFSPNPIFNLVWWVKIILNPTSGKSNLMCSKLTAIQRMHGKQPSIFFIWRIHLNFLSPIGHVQVRRINCRNPLTQ